MSGRRKEFVEVVYACQMQTSLSLEKLCLRQQSDTEISGKCCTSRRWIMDYRANLKKRFSNKVVSELQKCQRRLAWHQIFCYVLWNVTNTLKSFPQERRLDCRQRPGTTESPCTVSFLSPCVVKRLVFGSSQLPVCALSLSLPAHVLSVGLLWCMLFPEQLSWT